MASVFQPYKEHYKTNLKLAVPVVISQLGHTLVQTADSIIVGHFAGTISLAAVSLVNSIFVVVLVAGLGISYGLTPLIAQHNGRHEHTQCGRLLANSLLINCISAVILFAAVYYGSVYMLTHLHQSPAVAQQARPYLFLLGLSLLPLLVFNTFKQFTEGLGFTRQAMYISIGGNILNICLGIIFVKGLFGVHPMGIAGVGYSTLIDRCVMAIIMASFVFRHARFKSYIRDFALRSITKARSIQVLKIGAPVAMQGAFEVSAFGGAAIMIGTIGAVEQAAHQVAINLSSITYMMASGISAAAAIKSGNYFGVRNHESLRSSALASYHIVLAFMLCTALFFAAANRWLPWLYTNDEHVIVIASRLLIIAALFQLFDGAQVVGLGILRGMGDVNIPTLITFLAYWILGLPIGYCLGFYFHLGVAGIWYGLVLGLLIASALLYLRFNIISTKYLQLPGDQPVVSEIDIIG